MGREIVSSVEEMGTGGSSCWSSNIKLPLLSLNHVSFVCKSVSRSVRFYEDVLGFVLIKRPSSFKFEGAWLFNYGIGIHLLESDKVPTKKGKINPKDNHISFQCSDMGLLMDKLRELGIEYVTAVVEEGGITVDQLFFHDPDGYMIEICNCQNLPVLPLSSCPLQKQPTNPSTTNHKTAPIPSSFHPGKRSSMLKYCSGEVDALMMDNFVMDMMDLAI
ncbi:glyoxylase I 4-like [Malania oleifera]|uniref:glyoxylase I 4-like n=1 Tax=Malania oleifera TaxID=397392 RepID=UPI0025AE87CF|nr:glyoxylase I 4-like [Malania oleifera]